MTTKLKKELAFEKAKKICSLQEKCKSDILKKLVEWGQTSEDAEQMISKLEKENYINELRYAEYYVEDKFKLNNWGKVKIEYMLKQKGIETLIIDNAMQKIDDSEYKKILRKILKEKVKKINATYSYTIKAKLIRYTQSKGFETELSLSILDDMF